MHDGQKVGPFQIENEIGSGAMGQVYLARYIKNGQKVAIKVMAAGLRNATAQARFQREAEVLQQLNHPNIVRFYVVSEFEGAPYYAMEFVEGEPLDSLLERRGKLPWDDVVEIGKQICAALQHAHQQGIIHRDLKPSNLMIMKDGTVKLTDFGIAKDLDVAQLTATNNTVGTAAYMSPEQCRGERNLTHKSDLYSLGVVLYELLVGAKPFEAETTMDLFLAHVQGTFERPSRKVLDIPVWLDTLVCQLLEKKPDQRPLDAAIVSQALLQVAEKIQAQSSAGVDAARSRLADRNLRRSEPDTKDRKAARTLLETSKRRKRRKSQKKRVYEQAWFQAIGLASLLAIVATLVYVAFRAPSEKKLYDQVLKSMEAEDPEAEIRAIKEYKRYYPDATTSEAEHVRQWADEIEMKQRERSLNKRKKAGLTEDNDAEKAARKALDHEDNGEVELAGKSWQQVLEAKGATKPDILVANAHLNNIAKAQTEEDMLKTNATAARNGGTPSVLSAGPQRSAATAIRYEMIGDWGQALTSWQNFLREYMQEGEIPEPLKPWIILAKRKAHEIKAQHPDARNENEEKKVRLAVLDDEFAKASVESKDFPLTAVYRCRDILDLYAKDKDPEVVKRLVQFQKLLETLPRPGKG